MMSISYPRHRTQRSPWLQAQVCALLLCALPLQAQTVAAQSNTPQTNAAQTSKDPKTGLVTLRFHEVALRDVFDLLSRQEKANILLGKGVDGQVSINLYNVTVDQAVRSVAEAAGYAVEQHHGSYLIVDRKRSEEHTSELQSH